MCIGLKKEENSKQPVIAVLMTVHNRKNCTLGCLQQLFLNNTGNYKIDVYLVDDGCTDGTPEAVSNTYPNVKIIKGDGTLYWNRGMLLAWQEALKDAPDFYLWLNDDTFLFKNAIQILLDACEMSGTKDVIICGSTHAANDDNYVTYGGRRNKKLLVPNGRLQEADWLNGNCVLIPSKVVEQVGMLDPFFRHSQGDWEYGIRAKKKGIKLLVAHKYIGTCESNKILPKCYDSSVPFKERWGFLSHPLGPNPKETLYYCRKCLPYGTLRACFYIIQTYAKTIFPKLF